MNYKLLILAFLVVFTTNAQQRLSVNDAQQLGLTNNTEVKNARLDVKLAKKKVMETVAIGLPKIN